VLPIVIALKKIWFSLTGGFDQFAAVYFAWRKIVLVTPDPGFSGLNGTHEWMPGVAEVFSGVLVF